MSDGPEHEHRGRNPLRGDPRRDWLGDHVDQIAVILLAIVVISAFVMWFLGAFREPVFARLFMILLAATASFFIVANLRQPPESSIAISGLGFKISGNAGRPILWILCFCAIVIAMHIAGIL
jgi:hypothetical protein